ncbi:PadR family transcriptional regulator [Paenibacillus sp. 1011MAR3C5]|uniref:helix-turn-helix transcriptional regulator n=1 Tax=Paenibacillus sp. 1011MAR3C5 TaxID=1675787 RepID=UPI000E6BAD8A|nr:helix-turn-helix transcriptional regulator [Paenibacillus sp. 1011MAR3C5]RJE85133.1 PadR family transcriptional regulator [Paenibacillus sp. 1011MAR3C5]
MEHVILGLLMIQSQTLYELHQSFTRGISLFYSASYGSLQTALKKLLDKERVACEELVENGRLKKVYHVLPQGREEFFRWMQGETPGHKLEVAALSKLFFLGHVEHALDKRSIVAEIMDKLEQELAGLEQMERELVGGEVPERYRDIFRYQLLTLNYGLGAHRYARDWFGRLREEL